MGEPTNPCKCIDCGGTEPTHSSDCTYMNETFGERATGRHNELGINPSRVVGACAAIGLAMLFAGFAIMPSSGPVSLPEVFLVMGGLCLTCLGAGGLAVLK